MTRFIVVADACCNHMGSMTLAKAMIRAAYDAGVDIIKFQYYHTDEIIAYERRRPDSLYTDEIFAAIREAEFGIDQMRELKAYADELGIEWMCTPFLHVERLRELESEERGLRSQLERLESLKAAAESKLAELREDVAEEVNEAVMRHYEALRLAELEPPILNHDMTLRLVRVRGVPTRLCQLSDSERAILAVAVTFILKLHVLQDFPLYVVDNDVLNAVHERALLPLLKYLMDRARVWHVVAVSAVHGPPSADGLAVLANEEALEALGGADREE